MAPPPCAVGQIWRDSCYYLDAETGECKTKYVLILGYSQATTNAVTAVFTSKSHGLTEHPRCSAGPPRSGYFVSTPGPPLNRPTWVELSSLETLDGFDLRKHVAEGRKILLALRLPHDQLCAALRCAQQSDDLTGRQARIIGDSLQALHCA